MRGDAAELSFLPPVLPVCCAPDGKRPLACPDLAHARKLVAASGTKRTRVDVLVLAGKLPLAALGSILVQTLQHLGYRTSVRREPTIGAYFGALYTGVSRFEATVGAWGPDYPAPSGMLTGVFACLNAPYSCDPVLDRELRQTLELQNRNPQTADAAWAKLEQKLVERAIVVPVINPNSTEFVSKRLGNYQRNPHFGMLISQAWVR